MLLKRNRNRDPPLGSLSPLLKASQIHFVVKTVEVDLVHKVFDKIPLGSSVKFVERGSFYYEVLPPI